MTTAGWVVMAFGAVIAVEATFVGGLVLMGVGAVLVLR